MGNFVSYANATELMTAIGNKFATLAGAYIFKGSIDFDELPETVTVGMVGYTYNIDEEFTTDARFVEGAGKVYPAGTNVSIANVSDDPSDPELLFDVIGNFVDVAAIYAAIQDVSDMISAEFDATAAYSAGDMVVYDGALYKFTSDHAAGAWDSSEVSATTVDDLIDAVNARIDTAVAGLANIAASLADAFDASNAYAVGDIVMHENSLYKFKAAHTASDPWSASEVDAVTVDDLLGAEATTRANADTAIMANFADVFDATSAYSVGDVVINGNGLYKFKAAHTANDPWDATEVDAITVEAFVTGAVAAEATARANADAGLAANFADVFDASNAYAIGDVVVYENNVYKFKAAHTADDPWSSTEVDAVTLESLIDAAEPDELTEAQIETLVGLLD